MTCPPDIADILLAILREGILTARAAGWSGDADRAAIEADHVHNLPDLVANYKPQLLVYYWTAERPGYISQIGPAQGSSNWPLWERLRPYVEAVRAEDA